jgi:RNA polymerase sigma factor (TIGR02999 family)
MGKAGVTAWLERWNDGDEEAREVVFDLVYRELRALAASTFRRERIGHTLQPTAVVHEAVLRLLGGPEIHWLNRAHFFGFASRVMRQVLVDYSREKGAAKRGGGLDRISLTDDLQAREIDTVEMVALDRALGALEALAPEQVRIVEARFFAGLSVPECAEYLGISTTTVKRQWRRARAWLHAELSAGTEVDTGVDADADGQ